MWWNKTLKERVKALEELREQDEKIKRLEAKVKEGTAVKTSHGFLYLDSGYAGPFNGNYCNIKYFTIYGGSNGSFIGMINDLKSIDELESGMKLLFKSAREEIKTKQRYDQKETT